MNDEWWTPAEVIEPVRAALGEIDLDPCTHPDAQRVIRAANYYARPDDGLTLPWSGRVWLNPPYSKPRPWVYRLLQMDNGAAAACILTATSAAGSEAGLLLLACASVIALPGRVRFRRGAGVGSAPRDASVIAFVGEPVNVAALRAATDGWVIHRISDWRMSNGFREPVTLRSVTDRLRKLAPPRPSTAPACSESDTDRAAR